MPDSNFLLEAFKTVLPVLSTLIAVYLGHRFSLKQSKESGNRELERLRLTIVNENLAKHKALKYEKLEELFEAMCKWSHDFIQRHYMLVNFKEGPHHPKIDAECLDELFPSVSSYNNLMKNREIEKNCWLALQYIYFADISYINNEFIKLKKSIEALDFQEATGCIDHNQDTKEHRFLIDEFRFASEAYKEALSKYAQHLETSVTKSALDLKGTG